MFLHVSKLGTWKIVCTETLSSKDILGFKLKLQKNEKGIIKMITLVHGIKIPEKKKRKIPGNISAK